MLSRATELSLIQLWLQTIRRCTKHKHPIKQAQKLHSFLLPQLQPPTAPVNKIITRMILAVKQQLKAPEATQMTDSIISIILENLRVGKTRITRLNWTCLWGSGRIRSSDPFREIRLTILFRLMHQTQQHQWLLLKLLRMLGRLLNSIKHAGMLMEPLS